MKRPLVAVALVYGSGLLLADQIQPPVSALFAVSLAVAGLAIGWAKGRSRVIWPLVFLCGWTNLVGRTALLSPNDVRARLPHGPALVTVLGTLPVSPDQRDYLKESREVSRSLAVVDVRLIQQLDQDWEPSFGRILVVTPGVLPRGFYGGETVQIRGVLEPPPGPRAEGLFDYQSYLSRQGIYFQLKAESAADWILLSPARARPISDRFSSWAQATLARGLPVEDESLHLLWAMTLGWKAGLTNEIYEPFMRSGTMHIFAISGLHIALISGILVSVLRAGRVPRAWCGGLVVPLIWLYTGVTGWQPSAIRSAIMMTIVIGGWSLKRPSDLLNSLAAAALVILLWDPQQLFGASFQLSFFCVLSMALFLPALRGVCERLLAADPLLPEELVPRWRQRLRAPLRWLLFSVATSLAAWLGSLPLTACYFHLFSPVTLLANLLIVPLSSLALSCNVASIICGDWFSWAGELFNHGAWFWMECMMHFSQWAAFIPGSYEYVESPSLVEMVAYYVALVGVMSGWLLAPKRRAWTAAATSALILLYFLHWQMDRQSPRLTILPFNGGLSVYVRARSLSNDLLVDPGTTNSVEQTITPYLHAQGVNRLPTLLLTHGDVRHVGGSTLLADWFGSPQVWASPVRFRSPVYRRTLEHLRSGSGQVKSVCRGDRVGPWIVLHPGAQDKFPRADDNAIVLYGILKGTRVLLLSDLGVQGQKALLEQGLDLRADIVVSGLPTGGEALTEPFLEALHPELVILADSDYPSSEHASPGLQARLANTKIPIIYGRSSGATTIRFSRNRWTLSSALGPQLERGDTAAK